MTVTTPPEPLIDEGADKVLALQARPVAMRPMPSPKPLAFLFFAPFAASDALREATASNVFYIRLGLADEAYKVARHCATLNQERIAVFAEDDAMGRAGLAAVVQALADLKRAPIVASAL